MDRRFHKAIGLGVLATALTFSAAMAEDAKVGALIPMTGDLQAYGEVSLQGIRLAADEINAAGGVLDGKIDIRVGDTQTQAQAGIDAAKKLASIEGVVAIVGALSSGVTIPVAKSVSAPSGIPQISNASTSPVITTLEDGDFLFRSVPSDAFQGVALSQIAKEAGYTNLAVLYINNDYGEGLATALAQSFAKMGGKVTASLPYEPGNASYRGELAKAAEGKGQALVLIGYPENGITIIRQALEEGYFEKFIFPDGMKAPEIIDAIGAQYLEGSDGTAPSAATDTEANQRFIKAWEGKYGKPSPKPYHDTAYDATYLVALAIEKAGKLDGKAIRDALRSVATPPGEVILPGDWAKAKKLIAEGKDIDYAGASGPVNFDDVGDVSGLFAHWKIKGGKIVTEKVFEPKM